jgi:hypothetical protein
VSIYSTLWVLKFPRYGDYHWDCDWVEVVGQGVRAHIGTPTSGYGYEAGDPYADFLPPAVAVPDGCDGIALRAIVIVRDGAEKSGQRYVDPLLVLSGEQYAAVPFDRLHQQICDALRGDRPRFVGQWEDDGVVHLMFEDGSVRKLGPPS